MLLAKQDRVCLLFLVGFLCFSSAGDYQVIWDYLFFISLVPPEFWVSFAHFCSNSTRFNNNSDSQTSNFFLPSGHV